VRIAIMKIIVAATAVQLAVAGAASAQSGSLAIDGAYQATSHDFTDATTFRANAENGTLTAGYRVDAAPGFRVSGAVDVRGPLAVGVSVTRFSETTPVAFTGSIPHPFFFSQARTVTADVGGISRQEVAVHLQARGRLPLGRRAEVTGFGGPSIFHLSQDVLTDFTYTDVYPYDRASFGNAVTTSATATTIGVNVGVDAAFFFTRRLGIGFGGQFTRATATVAAAKGRTQAVTMGGLQTGGGLRVRF
jgi:hypothetical protein